jgi:hypothetical protein
VGEDQAGDLGGEARGEEAVAHAIDGMEKGGGKLGGQGLAVGQREQGVGGAVDDLVNREQLGDAAAQGGTGDVGGGMPWPSRTARASAVRSVRV